MAVKERLQEFISFKKMSDRQFSFSIGASGGYVSSMSKSLQPDKIHSISINYPELNTEWLLTGIGSMLKNNTSVSGDITDNNGVINNVVGNGNKVEAGVEAPKSNDFQRLMDIMEKQGDQFNERLMESQAQINKLIELLSKN